MATFKFWVPAASALLWQQSIGDQPIDPANLNKQVSDPSPTATDNTVRLEWGQAQRRFRLKGTTGAVNVNHDGIVSVKLHARLFPSNYGTFSWTYDNTGDSDESPYAAPYFRWDGSNVKYSTPDWWAVPPHVLAQEFVGHRVESSWNWNDPGNPSPTVIQLDITSWPSSLGLGVWTNGLLSNREFGLAMDYEQILYNTFAGREPVPGPGGYAPRWNVSQLILEVEATEPAPPPAAQGRTLILVAA